MLMNVSLVQIAEGVRNVQVKVYIRRSIKLVERLNEEDGYC